jgi:dipeptidyl aminopeptidase/acylaminoacyl peptidase
MAEKQVKSYGSWKSPITSDLIVSETVGLGQPRIDGDEIYWLEMRPSQAGRNVIVRRDSAGQVRDMTPQPFNVRTRAHEYGGGDYLANGGALYFSNFADQRFYSQRAGESPRAITPESQLRFADPVFDKRRNGVICVREDHRTGNEAINTLVALQLDGNDDGGQILVSGSDFYSSPRVSPDGSRLAWLNWDHPNMPWDGCHLSLAEFDQDGALKNIQQVAGSKSESIFQPEWSPDGRLYFVSDRSGWWNLYRLDSGRVEPLCPQPAEFGLPQWVFGMSTYGFASAQKIVCTFIERGKSVLATLDTRTGVLTRIETKLTDISYLRVTPAAAVFRSGSPTEPVAIVRFDCETEQLQVLRRSNNLEIDKQYISLPESIEFPTSGGLTAHAFFYRPQNKDYKGLPDERPPLLVKSHGGPTAAASCAQSLSLQYWTSRGIAVLDVNYGGSTGFGRDYRQRLNDNWGIVDMDDCVNGALYLANAGEVDAERMMITGGSAGGYTTLCALTFRKAFKAGASHFGVSDVEALARDTHKFESRYLDGLIGPYPERRDIYLARSPINFTDQLSCPVIFFQGLEDKVVPPNQAELMVSALREKGIPVAYVAFAGEQHGFRQAQNIKRALDGELYFYSRVFGFDLADKVPPVEIENL